jgi:hypothetical protein
MNFVATCKIEVTHPSQQIDTGKYPWQQAPANATAIWPPVIFPETTDCNNIVLNIINKTIVSYNNLQYNIVQFNI